MDGTAQIVLLCNRINLQNRILSSLLSDHFDIQLISQAELNPSSTLSKIDIVIFDLNDLKEESFKSTIALVNHHLNNPAIVLLNVTQLPNKKYLHSFGNIRGIFQNSDSLKILINGLNTIMSGGYHAPPAILFQLISNISETETSLPIKGKLTGRELQVLTCVKTGATNVEIARQLFLSENTIKTHLYNAYKKLNVRNRTEAIDLASHQMASGDEL